MSSVPLSTARQALVRDRVLAGVAEVLAAGHDLTYAKVAVAADVPERTVYRHFPTRQVLMAAVVEWINERTETGRRPRTTDEAVETVRQVFPTFDEMAPLVREVLLAPEGRAARLADNDDRQAAAAAIVADAAPGLDRLGTRRVAAAVQLLTSAAAWQSLADYWEMDGAEAAETVALALSLIVEGASTRGRTS